MIGEFKTALGIATQSASGLLSAEDKTHLDGLVALLESDDGDSVVNTIAEILAIFDQFPEGADLLSVLATKSIKKLVKGLSANDYSDIEKNKVALSDTHRQALGQSTQHPLN